MVTKKSIKILIILMITGIALLFAGCSNIAAENSAPIESSIPKKDDFKYETFHKDVNTLVLMYVDGDNNLEPYFIEDLNEASRGLNSLKESDSVEVIALWDGDNKNSDLKYEDDTFLYRILPGEEKINLNNTTKWIHYMDENGKRRNEVSMSDPNTLENFLAWAKEHYSYKNLILEIADHGLGPGSMEVDNITSRAVCLDDNKSPISSNSYSMGSKDVAKAIMKSGIKHIDILIMNCCFGCSMEDAYEFKTFVDYMLCSPNAAYAYVFDYEKLISYLTEGDCIRENNIKPKELMKKVSTDFIDCYSTYKENDSNNIWEKRLKSINDHNMSELDKPLFVSYKAINESPYKAQTVTGLDLSKINDVKDRIDDLVTTIKNSSKNESYIFLKKLFETPDYYNSSLGRMYDIGHLLHILINLPKEEALKHYSLEVWNEIKAKAEAVKPALRDAIVCSWRDGYGGALYNKSSRTDLKGLGFFGEDDIYGLPIMGITFKEKDGKKEMSFYENYNKDLAFGADSGWYDFIQNVMKAK